MSKGLTIELPAEDVESAGISKNAVCAENALDLCKAGSLSVERAAERTLWPAPLFKDASHGRHVGKNDGPQNVADDSDVLARPLNPSLLRKAPVVVGVDVGGLGKGFHAVALTNGCFAPQHFKEAKAAYEWILEVNAKVVAIDAPCGWAVSGKSRLAERELAIHGKRIHCFKTPARTSAVGNPFYGWVFNGETLYELLSASHDLFDGSPKNGPVALETFPHAVACALAGSVIPASPKGITRRRALSGQGFDVSSLTNIDFVDAALCALTALQFHLRQTTAFGNAREGFIVVPQCRGHHPPQR